MGMGEIKIQFDPTTLIGNPPWREALVSPRYGR